MGEERDPPLRFSLQAVLFQEESLKKNNERKDREMEEWQLASGMDGDIWESFRIKDERTDGRLTDQHPDNHIEIYLFFIFYFWQ